MSIKPDKWITRMVKEYKMIEPYADAQVKDGAVSFGVSSYGYDIRIADEFKIFTNINSTVVDPKGFDPRSFVDYKGDVCIIPPNSFALGRSVEYFRIPRNVLTICVGKSTYARCGIITNVTPFEPEWGRLRDARDFQHDAAAGKDLRQRRHRAGALLRERRGVPRVVCRQEGQVPETGRNHPSQGAAPGVAPPRREEASAGLATKTAPESPILAFRGDFMFDRVFAS